MCVWWNNSLSDSFCISNGVRQGGVLSPILFAIYIDCLLEMLESSGVGCCYGGSFVGALAYADDVVLLAPCTSALRLMLHICNICIFSWSSFQCCKNAVNMFSPWL